MLRRNPNNSFRLAAGALIVCSALAAHAEQADRSKPINIEADQASLDQQKGVTVYEGNVILTQGTSKLTAAKLTVNQDKAGNQFGTAIGNPAT
ncbi:MAG: lipopolysaccharide transport periplasmic protein LptA, partial [Microvirgula sp.]